jgi:signal transduction histidine kinase
MRGYIGPVLAILLIAVMEVMYSSGAPVHSPKMILLLPIMFAAAYAGMSAALATGAIALSYLVRHLYIDRREFVSGTPGLSQDDLSAIAVFLVAALGMAAIARFRDHQRGVQASLERAYAASVEAEGARSQLLAVVSHELRTPLATIIQYTDLLIARIGGDLSAEQAEMLARIETASLHLRGLIQQLLDYAELGRGAADAPRIEEVEMAALVRGVVALLEPVAAEKGLELRVEVPMETVSFRTDPRRLRQIVLNLTDNAIKFTDAGGVVVRLRPDAPDVEIEVSDTGVGISDEALPRIFEPFWQSEDALTRHRSGLGLGLAIVRDLVAGLGGAVMVRSEPSRGSVFLVRLTALPAETEPPRNSPVITDGLEASATSAT